MDRGPVRPYVAGSDPEVNLVPASLSRIWVSGEWILRELGAGTPVWEVARRTGGSAKLLAFDGVGGCGQPLMDGYALGLDKGGHEVLALSMADGPPNWRVPGVPLDKGYCLAGENGIVAVGGRHQQHPALAVYQRGAWQLLHLPDSRSLLEPVVQGGRIFVSAPEEEFHAESGATIQSAGAVYVVELHDGVWSIQKKIVAAAPRKRALFGFKIHATDSHLYVNYLADGPRVSGGYFGDPAVCEVDL